MRVVKLPVHQVVRVVSVWNGFMAAIGPMLMVRTMAVVEAGRALRRVLLVHRDAVLVHMILVRVVQTAIVQVVRVALVLHGRVAAVGAVLVRVAFVDPVVMLHVVFLPVVYAIGVIASISLQKSYG
jgi:hypothetical protein